MDFEYIIVQAGGKGTRLEYLTANRPKALVPINNLPMIFHLFRCYPDKKFIIIGDYHFDVFERYLNTFATVSFEMVNGTGHKGTCAGMQEALGHIPEQSSFMVIWSDLVLSEPLDCGDLPQGNYIGLSQTFPCRWRYEEDIFEEIPSSSTGVAGLFLFQHKEGLQSLPIQGELVRWFGTQSLGFTPFPLVQTVEYGLLEEYEKLEQPNCRPFNKMTFSQDRVVKEAIDPQGEDLAKRELLWYEKAKEYGFTATPTLYSSSPLTLEYLPLGAVHQAKDLSPAEKSTLLTKIVTSLQQLHQLGTCPFEENSYHHAYLGKTWERLKQVEDLIPFAKDKTILINGKTCRNIFYHWNQLESLLLQEKPEEFHLIHGDCTFSNILLKTSDTGALEPAFIDPRGYFGHTELFGDASYDWGKLYYSIVGNYDAFNLKKFRLSIQEEVTLDIESNGWESLEQEFFQLLKGEVSPLHLKTIHGIIWLSLTTYAWQDYDSVCAAFYQGLYYLEDCLP